MGIPIQVNATSYIVRPSHIKLIVVVAVQGDCERVYDMLSRERIPFCKMKSAYSSKTWTTVDFIKK